MKIRELGTAFLDLDIGKLFNKLRGFAARIWQAVKWPLILLVIISIAGALFGPMATHKQHGWYF